MNYIFEKIKSFYLENTKAVNKYTQYGIFTFILYYYPTVFLSALLTLLVFNKIEAEIKFNADNTIAVPRFNFEMVEIQKVPKVETEVKNAQIEPEDELAILDESDDEKELSKSVILDKSISNEIKCSTYKAHFGDK